MLLPSQFWVQQGNPPWCGGVERALMSTTADMAVAFHYANGKGTVVEIDVGRIQTGGDVSFLSMVCVNPIRRCFTRYHDAALYTHNLLIIGRAFPCAHTHHILSGFAPWTGLGAGGESSLVSEGEGRAG